mgnify:CR=1 FL=1
MINMLSLDKDRGKTTLGSAATKRVEVVPWDPAWKNRFEELQADLLKILSGIDMRVEHVGSTSVPGLASKPILDVDVVLQKGTDFEQVKNALEANGYHHVGDLGIAGREVFKYDDKPQYMSHHLYILSDGSEELRRHLTFRDWLRSHPADRELYAQAKIAAARRFPNDIAGYIDAKSGVIFEIYRRCGLYCLKDLPELARSVLSNRYNLRVGELECKIIQPGVNLCLAQTSQGTFYLLAWEKPTSATGEISLNQSASDTKIVFPLPTASGQQLCSAPFAVFALFKSEEDALIFFASGLWNDFLNR